MFGGLFYLLWGNTPFNRARTQHQYEPNPPDFTDYMRTPATAELAAEHPRRAAPVSYTHLDVYKRQGVAYVAAHLRHGARCAGMDRSISAGRAGTVAAVPFRVKRFVPVCAGRCMPVCRKRNRQSLNSVPRGALRKKQRMVRRYLRQSGRGVPPRCAGCWKQVCRFTGRRYA